MDGGERPMREAGFDISGRPVFVAAMVSSMNQFSIEQACPVPLPDDFTRWFYAYATWIPQAPKKR